MKTIHAADLPFVPAGHENPLAPGVWKKVLLQKADLRPGAVQMVNWAKLPVGHSFAPHYHEDMQEIFVMIAGEAQITAGGQTAVLHRGDAVLIDAREIHQMSNHAHEDAEYLAIGIAGAAKGRTVVVDQSG